MVQFSQQYQQMQEEFILLDQAYLQQQKQSKAFIQLHQLNYVKIY